MIIILGAGESGVGAAILAKKKGIEVFVSDKGFITDEYKNVLLNHGIQFEEGQHSIFRLLEMQPEEAIKSPGIPDSAGIIVELKKQGIPVISEIEFAGRYSRAKKICITGSNGKTTTTLLIYHILKKAGMNVGVAGNVGKSLAWQVAENDYDYYVIELSSFQLDGMYDFRADIAILLNITPDHLDRYDSFQHYAESKFRITQNQKEDDVFIYWADDKIIAAELKKRKLKAIRYPFSIEQKFKQGAYINKNQIIIQLKGESFTMSIQKLALEGKHNIFNSLASGIVARVLEIRKELIRESLSDMEGIEHRREFVVKVHGISFINDSKATNINSTWYALESTAEPIIWIVGGVDKGNDYTQVMELVRNKVKAIICIGEDNTKIHRAFTGIDKVIVNAASMAEAVAMAYQMGTKNDTVLLSPACASFDLFNNYEDRGRQFKEAVRGL